jgi:gliding motility-associated-like protein
MLGLKSTIRTTNSSVWAINISTFAGLFLYSAFLIGIWTMKLMKHFLLGAALLLITFPSLLLAQGVSCPAVVAGPDTSIVGNTCVQLRANPVSGFTTTDYLVQPIPYSPYPYNAGTSILVNIDDVWGSVLPIGFNFCFYGNVYNQCVVSSNGVVTFDLSQAGGYSNWLISQGIPGNPDVLNSILGPFHDIDPGVGGNIYWAQYGTAPCRVFVVSFYQIPMFSCNNLIATQQIVLYETTNIIEVYVENKPTCAAWNDGAAIEGIQNAAGTQAVVVPGRNYPTNWNAANDAYSFVPNGVRNYTISWFEVGNPVALTNLDTITVCPTNCVSNYYAEVVYTNCDGATVTVSDTATITMIAMVLTPSSTDVLCAGGSDGTATVSVTGNIGALSYQWSNGQTGATANNLAPGTYTVTVTDQGSCSLSTSVTVGQPSALQASMVHTDALCNGGSSGTAGVTASGGTPPYSYLWTTGSTNANISGLAVGTYSVVVNDAHGCTTSRTVTISEPTPLTAAITFTDIICFNGNDGTAQAQASGGTAPYAYLWSNGFANDSVFFLGAGTYTVTATDANGCTSTSSVTLVNPPQMALQIVGDSFICDYDSVRLSPIVSGGVAPYSYQWFSIPPAVNDTNEHLVWVGQDTRNYGLDVTDQNGCSVRGWKEVVSNPIPYVEFVPSRTEACDSATILFYNNSIPQNAAYHWEFSDGTTADGLTPSHWFSNGSFGASLTVTTNEGCVNSLWLPDIIHIIPTPEASFVSDPSIPLLDFILLSEATFTFNNTSPYYADSVNWSFGNGDSAFVGQVTYMYPDTGLYTVIMTAYNAYGCHTEASQTILILPDPHLWVPSGFTPNGDGLNDQFVIGGVEVKTFEMWVFDRWGKAVFYSDNITNGWDGHVGGSAAPEGVYVFKINATTNVDKKIVRAGSVTLIR